MRILAPQGYNRYGWMLGALWDWRIADRRVGTQTEMDAVAPFHNTEGVDVRSAVEILLQSTQQRQYPARADEFWLPPLCRNWYNNAVMDWNAGTEPCVLVDMQLQHLRRTPALERPMLYEFVRARVYRCLRRLRLAAAQRALHTRLRHNSDMVARVMLLVRAAEREAEREAL
jgi:hypothetical protein